MKKTTILTLTFISISLVFLIGGILIAAYVDMPSGAKVFTVILCFALFLLFTLSACKTEWQSGVYVCKRCGAEFEISMREYILSPHFLRSRRLKCPKCGRKGYCGYKAKG